MRLLSSLSALALFSSTVYAANTDSVHTVNLYYRNVIPTQNTESFPDPSSFKPLATLAYSTSTPHNARITSLTPPPNTTEYTSIALFDPKEPHSSRSTVTATRGFHEPYRGRFRLLLSVDGDDVLSASYYSFYSVTSRDKGEGKSQGKGANGEAEREEFDINFQARAPAIHLDRPAKKGQKVLGATGPDAEGDDGEAVEEKTFFQKYWWLLAVALVITLIAPGDK